MRLRSPFLKLFGHQVGENWRFVAMNSGVNEGQGTASQAACKLDKRLTRLTGCKRPKQPTKKPRFQFENGAFLVLNA
jgi:hypothetical protein